MLFNLVRFESQQILIADLPVQFWVFDRAFERLLKLLGVGLPSLLVQQTLAEFLFEIVAGYLAAVGQPKQDAVGQHRLEQVRKVERQRVPALARFV